MYLPVKFRKPFITRSIVHCQLFAGILVCVVEAGVWASKVVLLANDVFSNKAFRRGTAVEHDRFKRVGFVGEA